MKCAYHVDREATTACSGCGKPLCAKCALSGRDKKVICSRCMALSSAQEALQGMDQRLEEKETRKRDLEERRERRERFWIIAQWGIILGCLTILAFQAPGAMSGFREDRPIRRGTYATDAPTDGCIANLWRVAKLLQEGKTPGPQLVCPESHRPYALSMEGQSPSARCPNPERHKVKEIRVSMRRPVPEVIP
ncbi:MAG: hypothetical protein AB1512_15015 [Thermodesulfobacteriota bacterium]